MTQTLAEFIPTSARIRPPNWLQSRIARHHPSKTRAKQASHSVAKVMFATELDSALEQKGNVAASQTRYINNEHACSVVLDSI